MTEEMERLDKAAGENVRGGYKRDLPELDVIEEQMRLKADMQQRPRRADDALAACLSPINLPDGEQEESWEKFRQAYSDEFTDTVQRIENEEYLWYNSEYALKEVLESSGEREEIAAKTRYLFARTWEAGVSILRLRREEWSILTGNGLTAYEDCQRDSFCGPTWYDAYIRPKYGDASGALPASREDIRLDYELALLRRDAAAVRFLVREMELREMWKPTMFTARFDELRRLGSMSYPLPHPARVRTDMAQLKTLAEKEDRTICGYSYLSGCLKESIQAWGEGESLGELQGRHVVPDWRFDALLVECMAVELSELGDEMVWGGQQGIKRWQKLIKQMLLCEMEMLETYLVQHSLTQLGNRGKE